MTLPPITSWFSKKWLGMLTIAGLLVLSALIVKPENFGALSLALAGLYAAFAGTNTLATMRATAPGTTTTSTTSSASKTVQTPAAKPADPAEESS